jgi:ABC-type nitrate/sulfonate/bicarbonate transport system substrate-binding protein
MGNFKNTTLCNLIVLLTAAAIASCSDVNQVAAPPDRTAAGSAQDLLPLTLSGNNRAVTKLPLIIAWDQGLFEKHGLDMNLLLPGPDFDGGREIPPKPGMEDFPGEIVFRGATPMLLNAARNPDEPHQIDIGSTDCAVRGNVIGRMGIESEINSLEDLRGKRIGISNLITVQGFQARLLAERMGWDYTQDFTLIDVEGDGLAELSEGAVDVIFATELTYSAAKSAGYPVLFDFGDWDEETGGNSIAVNPDWLEDPTNREKARRLLMAVAEAISIFHQQPDVTGRILREWNGVQDPVLAQDIIERGAWLPRKPYACVAGLQKTVELFPEIVAGRFTAEDFYDNSIMEEIDATGFLDNLYN